jgi:WS/DGAT/MGAT family acyltransferase
VPPLPSAAAQLVAALRDGLATGGARLQALVALLREPRRALEELGRARDAIAEILPLVLGRIPPTPFNGHVSILRRVTWTTISLAEVKAIRNRLGGTVNDVVLAAIASALRAYLERHGFVADRVELRAMLPVNVRTEGEHLRLGNRISMVVAPLPVGIFDPLERFRQVRTATAQLKARGQAAQVTRVLELLELLPPVVQRPLGWLQVAAAPINTICTNVPGPAVSLYTQGQRLETLVPIVPLAQGVGLAFAILSYADTLTVCLTTDPALVPDDERLRDLVRSGLEELRALAGVESAVRRPAAVRPERQRRDVASRAGGRVAPGS